MRELHLALVAATAISFAPSALRSQQPSPLPSAAQQIAAAVTPLPEELRGGAAVLGYVTPGKLVSLREGTNRD